MPESEYSKLIVKVKKKGKTRGRPSKAEIWASKVASELFEKNKDAMNRVVSDSMIYGTGAYKLDKKGNILPIDPISYF